MKRLLIGLGLIATLLLPGSGSAHNYETRCAGGYVQIRYAYQTPYAPGGGHSHVWGPWQFLGTWDVSYPARC